MLEKIKHWSWNPFEEKLEKNLQQLEEYVQATQNFNPKQDTNYKGFRLGRFLTKLRQKYRKGKLDDEIIKRVEGLGIKFTPTKIIGNAYYYD